MIKIQTQSGLFGLRRETFYMMEDLSQYPFARRLAAIASAESAQYGITPSVMEKALTMVSETIAELPKHDQRSQKVMAAYCRELIDQILIRQKQLATPAIICRTAAILFYKKGEDLSVEPPAQEIVRRTELFLRSKKKEVLELLFMTPLSALFAATSSSEPDSQWREYLIAQMMNRQAIAVLQDGFLTGRYMSSIGRWLSGS